MPPLMTDRCGGSIMFSGCPSVRFCASVRVSVHLGVRPVNTISYKLQTNGRNVRHWLMTHFEATDELFRF